MKRASGFTAVEVLVSIAILAIALVPVLTMLISGNKESAYGEYQMIAQTRAESILQVLACRDWQAFAGFPQGTPTVVPETLTSSAIELPEDFRRRLAGFEETVTFTPLDGGLAEVAVDIAWLLPGEGAESNHQFRLRRLMSRPDAGLAASYVPRQAVAP
ncbi:MAG: prepilin-type N-terminal cleavage/methylation domain-containing protein [Candidatus Wallbacteria bacterium]|nr:prepilin-type N-terminal cleavage/methylation domain-containing protein [Candidatus Wallbacteria bacterium]